MGVTSIYEMHSRWRVAMGREELWDIVEAQLDSADPMPWWQSLKVISNEDGILQVKARSSIGYTLRFRIHDLVTERPERLSYASDGDLRGTGMTSFRMIDRDTCALDFEWNVSVDRSWMRRTSWVLRPLFVLGHHLVMAQGERSFNRWLARRGTV